jgi:hypothetical protein
MTPEEELARLDRLLHQYESVFHTTKNPEQRERVARQIKDLRAMREKILAVNVIDPEVKAEEEPAEEDELASFPLLAHLRMENQAAPKADGVDSFASKNVDPTPSQEEMFNLCLYIRRFEREFIPFLTGKHLRLDFKFSLDRDSFFAPCQAVQRAIADYRGECRRVAEGQVGKDLERETRARTVKLARQIAVEGARLFRGLESFAAELAEDAGVRGTKCLNGDAEISFDALEGRRLLQGRRVRDALDDLARLSGEAVAYLNVPDIEIQESERADRH